MREFDKVINLFIERFLFNTEAPPTLNHLFNLKQNDNERAKDFIHRWRSTCNRMKDPISEGHALSIILNNFSQPLKGLISTSPSKSFIKLIERVEWLEMGLENGTYHGITLAEGSQDVKKKTNFTFSTSSSNNNNGKNKRGGRKNHTSILGRNDCSSQENGISRKNNIPPSSIQLESKPQGKSKHNGWGYDREFTPLEQSLEEVLEYMTTKEMVKLPKVADPPVTMGRFKDQFCKFHRVMGHDIEYCFVFKNIVQDCIDKKLLVEDQEKE